MLHFPLEPPQGDENVKKLGEGGELGCRASHNLRLDPLQIPRLPHVNAAAVITSVVTPSSVKWLRTWCKAKEARDPPLVHKLMRHETLLRETLRYKFASINGLHTSMYRADAVGLGIASCIHKQRQLKGEERSLSTSTRISSHGPASG
jgi:hypothetical protein